MVKMPSMRNNHNNLSAYVILTNTDVSYYSLSVIYILVIMKPYAADYKTMNVFIGRHIDLYTSVHFLYATVHLLRRSLTHVPPFIITTAHVYVRTCSHRIAHMLHITHTHARIACVITIHACARIAHITTCAHTCMHAHCIMCTCTHYVTHHVRTSHTLQMCCMCSCVHNNKC